MRKLDPCNPAVSNRAMYGLSTEAGGGGDSDDLARDLRVFSRSSPIMRFLGATCYLHGHILPFEYLVEKFFVLGDAKKRTLLQLLHAVYTLENEFEMQYLREVWLEENRTIHPGKII